MTIILKIISSENDSVPKITGVQILATEDTTLGRSSDCSLKLEDIKCSKLHLTARLAGNKVTIKDLDSRNGTYINGIKVKDSYLFLGDILKVGNTILTLDEANMTEAERTLLIRKESFQGSGSHDLKQFAEFPYPQTEQDRQKSNHGGSTRMKTTDLKLDKMGLAKQHFNKKMADKEKAQIEKAKSRKNS